MKSWLGCLVTLCCIVAVTPATAGGRLITKDKLTTWVKNYDPAIPNPSVLFHVPPIPAFAIGLPLCVMSTAFIKVARSKRALTEHENLRILVGCVIPIVGGMIVDELQKPKMKKAVLRVNARRPLKR